MEGGLEPAHRALGLLLAVRHQPKKALEQLDEAINRAPNSPSRSAIRHGSWPPRWTTTSATGRRPWNARSRRSQLSPGKQPEYWDTLAAAQAEAGEFKEAVEAAEKALEQARPMRDDDLIPGIQQRLELFKSGTPYHAEAQRPQRL